MAAILPGPVAGHAGGSRPVGDDGRVPGDVTTTAAGLVLLLLVALVADRVGSLGVRRDLLVAATRAVVQLTLVGLVVAAVLQTPALAPAYLVVMLVAASATSARRIRVPGRSWP